MLRKDHWNSSSVTIRISSALTLTHTPSRRTQSLTLPVLTFQFNQRQPFDHISLLKMLFDDLGNVFGLDLAVHRAVGIDHDGGADRAKADRAAFGQDDLAHRV